MYVCIYIYTRIIYIICTYIYTYVYRILYYISLFKYILFYILGTYILNIYTHSCRGVPTKVMTCFEILPDSQVWVHHHPVGLKPLGSTGKGGAPRAHQGRRDQENSC